MAGNRMSPAAQQGARANLASQMANVHTGDAEVDSLLSGEVARRARFAPGAAMSKPSYNAPIGNPIAQIGGFLSKMFSPKSKVKK